MIFEYDNVYHECVNNQTKANMRYDRQGQEIFVQLFIESNVAGIRSKKDGD